MCGTGKIKDINNTLLLWDPDRGRDLEEDLDMEKSLRYIGDYIYDNAAAGGTGALYVHPEIKINKTTEDKLGYISAADKLDEQADTSATNNLDEQADISGADKLDKQLHISAPSNLRGQATISTAANLKGQSAINAIGNLGGKFDTSTINSSPGQADMNTIYNLDGKSAMNTICDLDGLYDVSTIYSFYDNAGFILFLYSLAYDLQDEKYLSLAQSSLREFESYYERKFRQIERMKVNHTGQEVGDKKNSYAGENTESKKNNYIGQEASTQRNNMPSQGSMIVTAAFVYIYYNLSRMYSDNKFYEMYLHYLNELNQYDLIDSIDNYNNDEKTIKEYAVITILCLNIYQSSDEEPGTVESTGAFASQEVSGRDTALNIAQKYSKYLSTHFKNHDTTSLKTNFSIYALAFFMAGKILENEDYYIMGLNLIKEENHLCSYGLKKGESLKSDLEEGAKARCVLEKVTESECGSGEMECSESTPGNGTRAGFISGEKTGQECILDEKTNVPGTGAIRISVADERNTFRDVNINNFSAGQTSSETGNLASSLVHGVSKEASPGNLKNSSAGQIKRETNPGDSQNSNYKTNNKNLHLTGILGNLLARSRMLNYIKDDDMEIVRAPIINSLQDVLEIEGEEYSDISLCSGIFGKLEIISTLAYELKSSVLIKKSETMLKSYLSYIKDKQIESMIQNEKLNFSKGLTGIGYSILRQKNCRIPSILTFDVFKSDMEII